MASPAFYRLTLDGPEAFRPFGGTGHEVNGRTTNPEIVKGPLMSPPKMHDTSRIGWHMKDLECFAKNIETAVSSSFPNHGGSRYRSVNVSMMRWAQDELGVAQELNTLANVFEDQYGFNVETWQIPTNKTSHTNLMQKALDFLSDYDSEDNLFILYYAGHGFINQDRQSTWACSPDVNSPTVNWSHIQGLFERAKSDVLVLLDCCAAASSAPRGGDTLMETIAACGFESRAPPPGEHSFTTSLIEVLYDWVNTPSFSITMLHSEVLRVLMRRRKERCRNGQKLEWRSTPVHMNNFTHPRTIGIELCKRSLIDTDDCPSIRLSQPIEDLLQPNTGLTSTTYLDLMSLSCDALEERLNINSEAKKPSTGSTSDPASSGNLSAEVTSALKLPHMLISITLDEDQALPNPEACRRWICAFPGLAKQVKIEGVFASYSTVLILSIPVVIWNMLPDHPACQPITYVTSRNLILDPVKVCSNSEMSLTTNRTQSSPAMDEKLSNATGNIESAYSYTDLVDLQTPSPPRIETFPGFPHSEKVVSDTHRLGSISSRYTPTCETFEPSKNDMTPHRQQFGIVLGNGSNQSSKPKPYTFTDQLPSTPLMETSSEGLPSSDSLLRFQHSGQSPSNISKPTGSLKALSSKTRARYQKYVAQRNEQKTDLEASFSGSVEEYPKGWPQLTTLLNNEEKFWIYRRFKLSHSRVLLELESEISLIEQKLGSLDESHATLEPRQCRLQTAEFEGWDTTQQDLLQQLREKLLIYDELLLNHGKLWELGQASGKDHLNVFNEITKKNPIGQNQYDRNNFPDDFISLMPQSLIGQLEHFINKLLKRLFPTVKPQRMTPVDQSIHHISYTRLAAFARLFTMLFAMGFFMLPLFVIIWLPVMWGWISFFIFATVLTLSLLMSLCTNNKIEQLLIGTVTYCTVLVMFLGNPLATKQMDLQYKM